jgi:hypothetical protein
MPKYMAFISLADTWYPEAFSSRMISAKISFILPLTMPLTGDGVQHYLQADLSIKQPLGFFGKCLFH